MLVHRDDGLGQVDDARRHDRPHQLDARRAHHDGRGPDRVPPPRQEVDREPARGRRRHARASRSRCAAPCARTRTSSSSAKCATTRRSRRALTASETGHLVFSTLHTLDATETINRIIAVFPPHQQKQIRLQLGAVIKAVISLRLMPRADGLGRVPAAEILIRTNYVRECIENKEKTKYIKDAIQQGTSQYGMQTFDQSLYSLYKSGLDHARGGPEALDQPERVQAARSRASSRRRTSRARRWTPPSRRRRTSIRSRRSRPSTSPTSPRGAARSSIARSARVDPPPSRRPPPRRSRGRCACSGSGRAAAWSSSVPWPSAASSRPPSRAPSSGSTPRASSTIWRRRGRPCAARRAVRHASASSAS